MSVVLPTNIRSIQPRPCEIGGIMSVPRVGQSNRFPVGSSRKRQPSSRGQHAGSSENVFCYLAWALRSCQHPMDHVVVLRRRPDRSLTRADGSMRFIDTHEMAGRRYQW